MDQLDAFIAFVTAVKGELISLLVSEVHQGVVRCNLVVLQWIYSYL